MITLLFIAVLLKVVTRVLTLCGNCMPNILEEHTASIFGVIELIQVDAGMEGSLFQIWPVTCTEIWKRGWAFT